jgi:hypothetical protein
MLGNQKGFIFLQAIVVTLVSISVGTVAASQLALPGDTLYGVKTASEQVRVRVAINPSDKVRANISIAEEKLKEIEKLHKNFEETEKTKEVGAAEQALQKNISAASVGVASEKSKGKNVEALTKALDKVKAKADKKN